VHLVAITLAMAAMVAVWLPGVGLYVAMGAAILACAVAVVGFRQRHRPGAARLVAAGALTVATMALTLAIVRYALTLVAIDKLERLLG
jgi:hypothetical protein